MLDDGPAVGVVGFFAVPAFATPVAAGLLAVFFTAPGFAGAAGPAAIPPAEVDFFPSEVVLSEARFLAAGFPPLPAGAGLPAAAM